MALMASGLVTRGLKAAYNSKPEVTCKTRQCLSFVAFQRLQLHRKVAHLCFKMGKTKNQQRMLLLHTTRVLCNATFQYVPILAASLVCPRDIKFSEAWQLSGSDDEDKDTNQRVCKGRQFILKKKNSRQRRLTTDHYFPFPSLPTSSLPSFTPSLPLYFIPYFSPYRPYLALPYLSCSSGST